MNQLYKNLESSILASSSKYLKGQEINIDYRCSGTKLSRARQGDTVSDGLLSEVRTIETDENGQIKEKLTFRADWKTGGINMINGMLVQNYIQWPDPETPGKNFALYCNAEFNR